MTWAAVAGTAVSVVGGALVGGSGSQGPQTQQTQTNQIDPRMAKLLYGDGGLLSDTESLRKQQFAQGGLNSMQRAGMEMQRQSLMDPRYTQGYDQMRNQGASLMGQPVAQNPFSNGYQGGTNFSPQRPAGQSAPAVPNLGMGGQPAQNPATAAAYQPIPQMQPMAMPAPVAQSDTSALDDYMKKLEQQKWETSHGDWAGDAGGNFGGGM